MVLRLGSLLPVLSMPLGRSPPCYRWQTRNARPRNPFRLFCYASFRSRSITTTNICKNAEAFMTRGACDQRDCLTDPSPGPPESARQISSTCSPKLSATVSSIISNMGRKLGVCGGRFLEDAKISVSLAVAASLCRGVRCALLPGATATSAFACCGVAGSAVTTLLPNALRQTSFANEVAPKRDRATWQTYSSVG